MKFLESTKTQLIIVALLTTLVYSNIFQNGFVGDDFPIILDWDFIHHIENIPKLLFGPTQPPPHEGYRPLRSVYLAFIYFFTGSNPFGYHLISLINHLICTVLIYFITKEILLDSIKYHVLSIKGKKQKAKNRIIHNTKYIIPLLTALLFGLHPIHVESVTENIASIDNLGNSFFLASFLLFIKSKKIYSKSYLGSLVLGIIATFSYEPSVVLPFLLVLHDFLFNKRKLFINSELIKKYLPFFLIPVAYFLIRLFIAKSGFGGNYLFDSFYLTMLLMSKVLIQYLGLLIFPWNLSINHTVATGVQSWINPFTNLETIQNLSLFSTEILFNLGIIIFLFWLFYFSFKKFPVLAFGLGWFFISIVPFMNFIPQGVFLQERYLYIASFGYCLILGWIIGTLIQNSKVKSQNFNSKLNSRQTFDFLPVILIFTFLLLSVYAYRTYLRNADWKDYITMWESLVKQIPEDEVANFTLGDLYKEKKAYDKALNYYQRTLEIQPNTVNAYTRMGSVYLQLGDESKALENYRKALEFIPNQPEAEEIFLKLHLKLHEASSEGVIKTGTGWIGSIVEKKLLIFYPKTFSFSQSFGGANLKGPNKQIEIRLDTKNPAETNTEYIKSQAKFGQKIVEEGPLNFPNFDQAYVQSIEDSGTPKLQFFLFKDDKVVKIVISPAGIENIAEFDKMLGIWPN